MKLKPLHRLFKWFTFGQLSLAMLVICLISGVLLVVPYDVNSPYESISFFMLTNQAASLFRNMHYWSAQFFLVFTLIHLYDHFTRDKQVKVKFWLWFRLSATVLIVFLAMITGFILKGDQDAGQAGLIFSQLLGLVPLVGEALRTTFSGNGEHLQLVYVHHIATFSIFIVIVVLEHARTFWPPIKVLVFVTVFVLAMSILAVAPLHDGLSPVIKGPWYFVGFQELLHMFSHPGYSLIFVLTILVLLLLVPFSGRYSWLIKRTLLILTLLYLLSTVVGYFFRGANWQWHWPFDKSSSVTAYHFSENVDVSASDSFPASTPALPQVVLGRNEGCLMCHADMTGFSKSHNPQVVGCHACHGGNPFTPDKVAAHADMRLIPGNLSDAHLSCGTSQCHPAIAERIHTGLMSTLSGMISVDRFIFQEVSSPNELTTVAELTNSPADVHLKNLCVRCHLGNPKTETGPVTEESRGGGCLACHLNYQDFERNQDYYSPTSSSDTHYLKIHPSIDLKVSNNHCFGCHSRSGRISTNYEGWHETTLNSDQIPDTGKYRLVEKSRVFTFVKPDVHHQLGLDCIDCHNSYELMGDGTFYAHQEQQVDITCGDCHRPYPDKTTDFSHLDQESALIATLRFGAVNQRTFLATAKNSRALINTEVKSDSLFMYGKNSGKRYALSSPHPSCSQGKAHDALSCSACHSAWAPSCIGCHNAYDPMESGYDMVKNIEVKGSWVEYIGEYNAHLPALGVRVSEVGEQVIPVVPGMVLSIDLAGFSKKQHDSLLFLRLFAPSAPHTTAKKGRSCISCHNDPVALGYGKGRLEYAKNGDFGQWVFTPFYQDNQHDALPEDAWIGFLDDRNGEVVSTRTDVFPFSIEKQKRILTVGACLTCHEDDSQTMLSGLYNFDSLMQVRSRSCLIPKWK